MSWYKWNSIEAFNDWHNAIKSELGLPKKSMNSDSQVIENGVITDSYTIAHEIAENDVRAFVAIEYAENLIPSENPFIVEMSSE